MKKTLHPAAKRGNANYGWLTAAYSFSVGSYYDPSKMHFGALRVLNDDVLQGEVGLSPMAMPTWRLSLYPCRRHWYIGMTRGIQA